jgi:hypothetical protein
MVKKMNKRLLFLEFEDEVNAYLKEKNRSDSSNDYIIPLSLPVRLILKKNGIDYHNTLPYCDSNAHARAMRQSEKWLTLLESFTEIDKVTMAEIVFCIRPVINYLLWLSEVMTGAVSQLKPAILCGPAGKQPVNNPHWKMTPAFRPLGFMVKALAEAKGLQYQCIGPEEAPQELIPEMKTLALPYPSLTARIAASVLSRMVGRKRKGRKNVLITADGYGMGRAMNRLKKDIDYFSTDTERNDVSVRRLGGLLLKFLRGIPVQLPVSLFPYNRRTVEAKSEFFNKNFDKLAGRIDGEWRHQWEYEGLNLSSYISYKLRTGIRQNIIHLLHLEAAASTLLEKTRPAMVFTPFSSGIYALVGEACKRLDIPSMMITHGSHLPPRNEIEEIEQRRLTNNLMLAPHYMYAAAQTLWAKRHAEYFGQKERTFNTGPELYARTDRALGHQLRLKLGIAENASVIVYAVAQRKRSSVRFHVYETEDEYLQDMTDLVNSVNQMENAYLILKLHPSSEFTDRDMRLFLPSSDKIFILHREPFEQVLSAANVLVSYGSTTIEEAILNRIPVVQYDRWARYCHIEAYNCDHAEPGAWKTDASYYITRPDRLTAVLSHALDRGLQASADDELYRKHIFSSDKIQSLEYSIKKLT